MALTIITTAQVKTILGEGTSGFDTQIAALIPYAVADLFDYLGVNFADELISYTASELKFLPSTSSGTYDRITDNQSYFITEGFTTDMDVVIEGAYANDGLYNVTGVAAGTLSLDTKGDVTSMAYDDTNHALGSVRISKVSIPKGLKLVIAKMVAYLMHNPMPDDASSMSVDGVTTVYAGSNAYPKRILAMADKYRRPRFV